MTAQSKFPPSLLRLFTSNGVRTAPDEELDLPRIALPITWKEAATNITRYYEQMIKDKDPSLAPPLVHVFPIGAFLHMFNQGSDDHPLEVFGHLDDSSTRGDGIRIGQGNATGAARGQDGRFVIKIDDYWVDQKAQNLDGKERPFTHVKLYHALKKVSDTTPETAPNVRYIPQIIIAAATTEKVSVALNRESTCTQDRTIFRGTTWPENISFGADGYTFHPTLTEIEPLNWGVLCPPWCPPDDEVKLMERLMQ